MPAKSQQQVILAMNHHTITDGNIAATVKAAGAELCSLRDRAGNELMWQAGPAWRRHAPILFPIVGRLKGDVLRHRGKSYPMTQHGFARDMTFKWSETSKKSCTLILEDSPETRARYPFRFRLEVTHAIEDDHLSIEHRITNTGDELLPASIGAHPAFNWPLQEGLKQEDYSIVFSDAEPAPIRRLDGGLLLPHPQPTPIEGTTLALSKSLFQADAMILDRVASTSVRYAAPGSSGIEVSWEGFSQLGIWSKPDDAAFVCIEPWQGYASPVDFDGEFADKPGVMHLAVGETRRFMLRIRPVAV